MARVIIGVHGLGNKPDSKTLHSWWKQSMIEGLQKNGYSTKLPKLEMVYWADINHKNPLDTTIHDSNSLLFLDEKYTPSPPGFEARDYSTRKRVIKYLGQLLNRIFLNEDLTLKYAFIPNYFIRKYFKELDIYFRDECKLEDATICKTKELIKQKLLDTLEKYREDEILLISHSMGSIVAFDVLTFMAVNSKIHTLITIGSPLGLPIVISKIANQYKHNSKHTKKMKTPPGIYKKWFNFYDIMDKITFGYNLRKRYTPNSYNVKPFDLEVVNDYHNEHGNHNPHKSFGYLRTKEFAQILNSFVSAKL